MTIPFLGPGGGPLSFVGKSIRFVASTSGWLNYVPPATGGRGIGTISFWIKLGKLPATQEYVIEAYADSSNRSIIQIDSLGLLTLVNVLSGTPHSVTPTSYLVDNSEWVHVVVSYDTPQATLAARAHIYFNGFDATNPGITQLVQNEVMMYSAVVDHHIGRYQGASLYLDAILTDFVFVDGLALLPSQFAMTDTATGRWVPKDRPTAGIGSLGAGFWLSFDNTTSNATIGQDDGLGARGSGAGSHDFTLNVMTNAYTSRDYPIDSVGNGVFGHWSLNDRNPTLPLFSVGEAVGPNSPTINRAVRGTFGSIEPFYFEFFVGGADATVTVILGATNSQNYLADTFYAGNLSKSFGMGNNTGTGAFHTTGVTQANGAAIPIANNTAFGFAVDPVAGKAWIQSPNSVWIGGGDPQAGTLPTFTWTPDGLPWFPMASLYNAATANVYLFCGQTNVYFPRPARFKRLFTGDLVAPPLITSGTFTGNANADGPTVWCAGMPETLTINGNVATLRTHWKQLATGFKVVTASASYNASGANSWVATIKRSFKYGNAAISN